MNGITAKERESLRQLKAKHPERVLLYGHEGHYYAWGEDATILSEVCGMLLSEDNGEPMVKFPRYLFDASMDGQREGVGPQLLGAGHRMALCDDFRPTATE